MGSIFDSGKLFTQYRARIEFRDKLMGGVPKDTDTITGWLTAKMGVTDEDELRELTARTLKEQGIIVPEGATLDQLRAIAAEFGGVKHTNGFKRDDRGLYIEGRQVKAMLKESCNVLYAGERWGATRKGPKNYLAERVFVADLRIPLGRAEPDGVEQVIGHVSGPQGPQATLTNYEYVVQPAIAFTVYSAQDCIKPEQWEMLLIHAQENGLGSVRSQGYGTFDVTDFGQVVALRAVAD